MINIPQSVIVDKFSSFCDHIEIDDINKAHAREAIQISIDCQ